MIHIFTKETQGLKYIEVEKPEDLMNVTPLWLDVVNPSEAEQLWLQEIYGVKSETPEYSTNIEASERIYETEDGNLHLRADFMVSRSEETISVPVRFSLNQNTLYSFHEEDLPIIRLLRMRSRRKKNIIDTPMSILIEIFDLDVEYSADTLEDIYSELNDIGQHVLHERNFTDKDAEETLASIGIQEDLNGRLRRNLMDTRRALSFLLRERLLTKGQTQKVKMILSDIESLDGHTSFVFDKINFLMDTTIGFININQNKVVKIFSVASVALLPPTLIASIYGMNFKSIPELELDYGYPLALVMMLISVILPIYYFRKKGWL